METIDIVKGLSFKQLFDAKGTTCLTELLHWRPLALFANLNGCISSGSQPIKPRRYIDTYCNIIDKTIVVL